ncbi:hypothetical protein A9Q83_16640 [Alphaproteobacteria bacterium 46_93_T64]|nr:hypothetical protein A9Q83_16640 [Alphaproteobacteria bacterium 46_93_T64]
MSRWLQAARDAKRPLSPEMGKIDISISIPVQKLQKVRKVPKKQTYCSYCRYCTALDTEKQCSTHTVLESWTEGYLALIGMSCPENIRASRWYQFIADAGLFMSMWAEQAYNLGWMTDEVFGVHPTAPQHRPDAAGLIWFMNGMPITALTADQAKIKTVTGSALTAYRGVTNSVPAWNIIKEAQ